MDSNKKMKVLLVDDENICHMSVKSFSKKLDVDLDSAKNGHEAFEKVKSNNYNLILMDMIMPEMDGREATQLIRGLSNGKSYNIVGMSADVIEEPEQKSIGLSEFILKPVNKVKFEKLIQKYNQYI